MIQVNASNYELAQAELSAGRWLVDPKRGLLSKRLEPAGSFNTSGYRQVSFTHVGRRIYVLAHRIVWEAQRGPIAAGFYVNHIDGDKTNNSIDNLELVTHAGNMQHAYSTGLMVGSGAPGVKNWSAKLDESKVRQIRTRCQAGEKHKALALEFGVTRPVVSNLVARRIWKHVA